MAEYVRRKRPPATHPYWARLYDRAHPPRLVTPIAVPAVLGVAVGLYAGLQPAYSADAAARLAAAVATGGAVAVFIVTVPILWMDHTIQPQGQARWANALLGGTVVAAVLFLTVFVALFLLLFWYALGSGRGPWLGMAIGAGTSGGLAALIAVGHRRQWQARQRRWPRWERMRARRPRSPLSLTQIQFPPPAAAPDAEPRGQVGTGA